MRFSATSIRRRGHALPAAAALLLSLAVTGCADIAIVDTAPTPTPNVLNLPPIGFNHRFGNSPATSHDAFRLERSLFAAKQFWEVAVRGDPELAGYVQVSDAAALARARHAITSLTVAVATEDRKAITGLLAYASDSAQATWCETLLARLVAMGYDAVTSAQVYVYFTESDRHATLTWSRTAGYAYKVFDNDLLGTLLRPQPGQTPLPLPAGP